MKRSRIMILGFVFALSACNSADENKTDAAGSDSVATMKMATDSNLITAAIDSSHTAQNSLDWKGTYKGKLPCADCAGIEMEIQLNNDQTYTLTRKYLGKGKGEKISERKAPFSWINGSTIRLDGVIDGPSKYFVSEGKITQLDMDGKEIKGKLAEKYILTKQP